MNPVSAAWASAIGYEADADGAPTVGSLCRTLRAAVFENGFVTLSRLTSGLREAYRPLGLADGMLSDPMQLALDTLVLTGDLDLLQTAGGRAYAATPPRVVDWGGSQLALLGGLDWDLGSTGVRRVGTDAAVALAAATVSLADEIGRPDWLVGLVELGGVDDGSDDAGTLAAFVGALAASGDRFVDDPFNPSAVLSGRGGFFGDHRASPDGRWRRIGPEGTFPAVVRGQYRSRRVVLHVGEGASRIWEPPNVDLWRWIVVGATLDVGDDVLSYDATRGAMSFLVPPPRQLERAANLTGNRASAWTWSIDADAFAFIEGLISRRGPPGGR